jgi:NADPH-dependent 2,4-dienoyl-CoA reductase/sulfur reductase-like enzyme
MPYYIGDVIRDDRKLVARTPEKFRESGIEVHTETRVEGVDCKALTVHAEGGKKIPFDFLVFGTGTKVVTPGIPGEDREGVFVLKGLTDAIRIKRLIQETSCRKAVIIGAGFIGLEMSEAFRQAGIETTMVHRRALPAARWDPELSRLILEEMGRHGATFVPNTVVVSIEAGSACRLRLNTSGGPLEADLILLAMGVRPDADLAGEAGLALGPSGAIAVNFSQRTCEENIYAAGDCCESYHRVSGRWVNVPLGDIANKQGRVAGSNIAGSPMVFPGIVGAQSFKIFDLEAAATGLNEREATEAGFHPVSNLVWGTSSARSMPSAKKLGLRITADRGTGKLLGAQAVGEMGAVSRINTLSAALWAGMTLEDVAYLDLAYSPPFGGAWDPIHLAAQGLLRKL